MSYQFDVYDSSWKKVWTHQCGDTFADEKINEWLIHEYVVMYLANKRQATAHTKMRSEIRSSWRKLYRQKGTGAARVWDAASPIRRKWWVVFGPRNERNYWKTMNRKMKSLALMGALALKIKSWNVFWVDAHNLSEVKTKDAVSLLKRLWLSKEKTLIVVPKWDEFLSMSVRNISRISCCTTAQLNAFDVVHAKRIVFVSDSCSLLESRLVA